MGHRGGVDLVGLGPGGRVQLAVGGGQPSETQSTSWPASSSRSARRRAKPRPPSMAQVTGVSPVIDLIHLSSMAIRDASLPTVSGLPIRLPPASTATAT
jgi:hypothetical protein